MSGPPGNPFPVLVHPFPSPTRGSCAYELGPTSSKDALVFIGGLGDGPHTTPYIRTIAAELEKAPGLGYSVFEIRMSSSFAGYGFTSLKDDVADLSAFVQYLRGLGKRKVIFLGHSTGCQVRLVAPRSSNEADTSNAGLRRVCRLCQARQRTRRRLHPPGRCVGSRGLRRDHDCRSA